MPPTPIPVESPPRLVLRFALYAGIAMLVAAGIALLLARHSATSHAHNDLWSDAQYIAEELGRDDLSGTAFLRPVDEDAQAELDDFLGRIAAARDVLRASLVGRDGRVTYSTDHALIGRKLDRAKADAAYGGRELRSTTTFDGQKLLESFVPVRWALGDPMHPVGVLAVHRSYDAVAAEVREDFVAEAAGILLALLLLYATLLPILRRVTETLETRNRTLAQQAAELRVSEARYRTLMEEASDGILVADRDGRLLEVNARLCEITGYPASELTQLTVGDLIEPEDLERLPLRFAELLAGKTVLQERRLRRKDGSITLGEFHGTMLDDGRVHATLRDVTERRSLEEELREAHKLEAVGRLAAGVADDFEGLLTTIRAHADSLLQGANGDDRLRREAEEIRSATTWGSSLTRQLLALGGRQPMNPELIDLNERLRNLAPMLLQVLGPNIELVHVAANDLDRVRADPVQVEQVVVDLILHARHTMPHGGTVTVQTANVEFTNRRSELDKHSDPGRHVMLAISDTGDIGRPSTNAKLFEPYGEDDTGERIGLGLAAVYGVVNQSGGSIGIESEPGLGTTVRIYLPSAAVPSTLRAV